MSRASTFYGSLLNVPAGSIQFKNISTPSTPASDYAKLYLKSDILTYQKSSGTEVSLDPTAAAYLRVNDNSAAAPGFSFTSATGTGIFRDTATGYLGFSVAGTERAKLETTGLTLAGNLTVSGTITTIDSTTLSIADNMVVVNSGIAYTDGGLAVKRSNADLATDTPIFAAEALPDQTGAISTTVILGATASTNDGDYVGMTIKILSVTDPTPPVQYRKITAYVGATKTATVDVAWSAQPIATDTYSIFDRVYAAVSFHAATKQMEYLYITNQSTSTFTGSYVGARMASLTAGDGAAATPSINFAGASTTGLAYVSSAISFSIAGTQKAALASGSFNLATDLTVATNKFIAAYATGNVTTTGTINGSAGTVSLPAIYLNGDVNTGIYQTAADGLGIACNGAKVLDISSAGLGVVDGAAATPSINFASSATTGLYYAATYLGFSVAGAQYMGLSATALNMLTDFTVATNKFIVAFATGNVTTTGTINGSAGTVSLPAIYLNGDVNTGIYQTAADGLGIACNGAKVLDISSAGLGVVDGAAATPSINFASSPTTGLYYAATYLGFSVAGAQYMGLSATALNMLTDFTVATNKFIVAYATGNVTTTGTINGSAGLEATPAIYLNGDVDTGIYQTAANGLGISCGGTKMLDITGVRLSVTGSTNTAAAPVIVIGTDVDTGLYSPGANQVGIAAGGKTSLQVSSNALTQYASRTEGNVGTQTAVDQGTQPVVSAALVDRVIATLADSSSYIVDIDAYSVEAVTNAVLCLKSTYLVSVDGSHVVTATPLVGLIEDLSATQWQVNAATANTFKLQLYDNNTNAKLYNIKFTVQPLSGAAATIAFGV